ncbi:HupE/UreJ family protein [Candidatus Palauibacter sp.]|uniref:HupE/UreJ family protein n=1 Tax=Candidatus Palauibacter sp. TaxID=3101350 RepID=UPI003B01CBC8
MKRGHTRRPIRRTALLTGCVLTLYGLTSLAGAARAAPDRTAERATADRRAAAIPALPHEIPADVTVQAFVTPEGGRLRFLVRAPLEAMRDIEFPRYGLGYLALEAAGPFLVDAAQLWLADYVTFFEEDRRLAPPRIIATRISLPSDRSFASYATALAHFDDPPLDPGLQLPWRQALLDVLLEYDIESDESRFSIDPAFAHLGLRTVTVLRLRPPDRPERVFQYVGDPGLVRLDPRWHQAALRFVSLGFTHILDGIDHLLFLLCLVIPLRTLWGLVPVITSFTIAHSITLIASAFGIAPRALWFPPLIETLIALSIVYMALENILGAKPRKRWLLAFGFGLVHGFGFSFALSESLQFAGGHLLTSLLAFNVGVELGQLVVVAVAAPAVELLFRKVVAERMGTIIGSALLAHTGWHWMTDRGSDLLAYRFTWPAFDGALAAALMRWGALALIVVGAAWAISGPFGKLAAKAKGGGRTAPAE